MYKLERLNVIRMTDDENKKSKYIAQGFKLVEEEKPVKTEKVVIQNEINYSETTVAELQAFCKENNLTGYSDLKKNELIKFIKDNIEE
ncbi:Rho termination factor N-terminal domain-containing protein [Clostridium cellulovorans]|uniref:Rho termination factor-like N-terminal domain-containing protein n=1 Tax=Clostridium cellulovorans (strain ATCC 35296 / DSM 3052 / OCM 3 / 743B) TaxID=573061 RepID=D9SWD5_CLOC7|nr:Rho termination factor N-terminal domain-containing protein [Clostridium cellulovorans]ADL53217.1 hypothetical protein Clocel_3541 [Clostridium cellulovorans 743B]